MRCFNDVILLLRQRATKTAVEVFYDILYDNENADTQVQRELSYNKVFVNSLTDSVNREIFEDTDFCSEFSRTVDSHWERDNMSFSARIELLYAYCKYGLWDWRDSRKGKVMLDDVARSVPFDEHPWFALAGGWFCLRSRLYCSAAFLIDVAAKCADSDMMQELLDVRRSAMGVVNKKLPRDWMTDGSLWLMLWAQSNRKG